MGRESGGSFEGEKFHVGGIAGWAPGSVEDESTSKACGFVAWFGWYGGVCGEELFKVSARTNITNISTDATVKLAKQTLVKAPF